MKKVLMLVMFAILLAGFVFASEIAPTPTCKINAQITNVTYKEAYFLGDDGISSCNINIPAKYLLKVKITAVSTVNNEGYETCEELYPINSEKTLTIYKSQITSVAAFNIGEILEGNIHLSGDECQSGIYLTNYATSHIEPIENDDEENESNANQEDDDEDLNDSEEDENECEAWKCTKWSACLNEKKTRNCIKNVFNCTEDNEKPRTTKNCSEKDELKFYDKLRDCPEECVCSGSTIKCTFENGTRVMTVHAGNSGNVIVQVKNVNMSTNVTLYKGEHGKVYGIFRGNQTREIMLPDDIKERLQNRTRVRLYNESIDLNEDGQYHMNATKRTRLFWIFPVKERVEFKIDSETGEVTKTKTMWWGFLARDVRERNNSED